MRIAILSLYLLKFKIFFLLSLLWFFVKAQSWPNYYSNETGLDIPFSCSASKKCVPLHNCPELLILMRQQALPVYSLRVSICGYNEASLKVCCDLPEGSIEAISDPHPVYNLQCGQSLIRSNSETLGTYPFLVRVSFVNFANAAVMYPCSGVIINERTILTTATCALATSGNYQLHSVMVGDFDASTDPDCNSLFCSHKARHYGISHVIKYPSFELQSYTNNIALLRLSADIEFTATAQPICLPPAQLFVSEGKIGTLVGWGKLSFQRDKPSIQQWLKMRLISPQECSYFINRGLSVELCARGEQEPCSGYSGAPLISREGDNFFLIGVVSYGADCDSRSSAPTVFVDVQKYIDWIRRNL
ncbi:phenoloxidase-activating factor 1-like [Belonocnema kinseyi]|uniref:phenoloxidase-activating factor 1-like n=1 Tax=Belonocnema kinseyi TaxID=2817044 RepID=UPI00143DE0FE|nr:phenoloxidase-activating factor 1-like [Belonocnema kinseyi]